MDARAQMRALRVARARVARGRRSRGRRGGDTVARAAAVVAVGSVAAVAARFAATSAPSLPHSFDEGAIADPMVRDFPEYLTWVFGALIAFFV